MARVVRVTGAAVVLRTVDKRESYLYRGAIVPVEGFTDEAIAHAESLGLIEVGELEEAVVTVTLEPTGTDASGAGGQAPAGFESGVEIPEGAPAKAWTHEQIDAWAAAQTPVVVLVADASKDAKLDAIAAATKS